MNKLNLLIKIKNFWAKIKAGRDCDSVKMVVNPFRDWRRLLSVWLVFLLLVLGTATYLSWRISTLQVALSPEEVTATIQLDSQLVAKAKKLIEARALRFEKNRQIPPVLIDPGL